MEPPLPPQSDGENNTIPMSPPPGWKKSKKNGKGIGNTVVIICVAALLMVGGVCWMAYSLGEKSKAEYTQSLELRCDSLKTAAEATAARAENIQTALSEISMALDSVAIAEGMLLNVVDPETNRRYTQAQMRERVDQFGRVIERQKQRIQELETLAGIEGSTSSDTYGLHRVISHLRRQLEQKEGELESMRQELAGARHTVATMRTQVNELTETVNNVRQQNANMEQALQVQNVVINECYVAIGTGNELANRGILTGGGFLRKRKLNTDAFSPALFQAVDIAQLTQIPVPGNKCKILTAMPGASYTISGSKGNWVVTITNPTSFWSVSNYLVIQTD